MSYTFETMLPFMKVRLCEMPRDIINLCKRKMDCRWATYPMYFSRKPTDREHTLFVTLVNDPTRLENNSFVNLEAMAIAKRVAPQWKGTVLTVEDQQYECSPVIHPIDQVISTGDLITVSTASIMLKVNKEKEITSSVNTSVVKEGPLSVLMTPVSLANYTMIVGDFLQSKKIVSRQPEAFTMEVCAAITKASKDERYKMREATLGLFSKAKIQVDQKTNVVYKDPDYEYKIEGVHRMSSGRLVPVMVPEKLKCKIPVIPQTLSQGKETCNEMIKQIQSRFPTRLVKYAFYRGFPDDNQRLFMELRPFITLFPLCDPTDMMVKWMRANKLESQIRISGDLWVETTVADDETPFVFRKYVDGMKSHTAIFYGQVTFSDAFWQSYKVLVYRPSANGSFVFTAKETDVSLLPAEYCQWKLQVCMSSVELSTLLSGYTATLTTMVFKGVYGSRGSQYTDLKYPLDLKDYRMVNPDEMTEIERQESKHMGFKSVQGTQAVLLDEDEAHQPVIEDEWEVAPVAVAAPNPLKFYRGAVGKRPIKGNDISYIGHDIDAEDYELHLFTQEVPHEQEQGEVVFTYIHHDYKGQLQKWLLVGTLDSCFVGMTPSDSLEYVSRYIDHLHSQGVVAVEVLDD